MMVTDVLFRLIHSCVTYSYWSSKSAKFYICFEYNMDSQTFHDFIDTFSSFRFSYDRDVLGTYRIYVSLPYLLTYYKSFIDYDS